jgi:glycosyltransferase involved in cell wall biosynthesis
MRAAAEILKARPHAEVVIVGVERPSYGPSPPDGTNWKRFCLNETLASIDLSRVHFIDRLPYEQYLTLLQISSAHVYLTYPFVLSWSLIEAMAAGCVIVGSDTEPVREAITHEVNGVLASFHDSNAIARAVTAILAQPAAHAHLGVAARETAIRNYDERKCVPEALRLLNMNTLDPAAAGAGNSGAKTVAE